MLEPEPVKKLRRRAVAVWLRGTDCGDKVATILIKFRKNWYTVKKANLFTLVSKLHFLL